MKTMFTKFLKEDSNFSMMRLQSLGTLTMSYAMVLTGIIHALYATFSGQNIDISFVTICFSASGVVSGVGVMGKVMQKRYENPKKVTE